MTEVMNVFSRPTLFSSVHQPPT